MDQPNIVMIVVDALRADHLGCYGYSRDTSPNIDKLATQGVLAEQFICAAIPTQPSFTTLYTGQHPITHNIVANGGTAHLAKDAPFLTNVLLEEGYTTCAVDNLLQLRQWFARGYEFYIDPSVHHTLFLDVSCEELNARAIPWLRSHADESFFLFIHYWDPHWPLLPPGKYKNLFYTGNATDPENESLEPFWKHPIGALARDTWLRHPDGPVTDAAYVAALYDQEIRHLDDGIGALMASLDDLGLSDDTLVLFLADHGESITEHGIYLEHHGLYETTIRVPFIARWPGQLPAGVRIPQIIQSHDVAPTIIDAIGADIPFEMDGDSFWDLLTGESETGSREFAVSCECSWQAKWSIRTDRHKFILARQPDSYGNPDRELYDLLADPEETHNLIDEEPDLAAGLENQLECWIAQQLEIQGKTEDPLRVQGVSLGESGIG
jgi:arylsulfatase